VSSESSGRDRNDSTGLRAEQKLSTPLLRCEIVHANRRVAEGFENEQSKLATKGSRQAPLLAFSVKREEWIRRRTLPCDGGDDGVWWNGAGDDDGRATRRRCSDSGAPCLYERLPGF
jgi:hypothetical protein